MECSRLVLERSVIRKFEQLSPIAPDKLKVRVLDDYYSSITFIQGGTYDVSGSTVNISGRVVNKPNF